MPKRATGRSVPVLLGRAALRRAALKKVPWTLRWGATTIAVKAETDTPLSTPADRARQGHAEIWAVTKVTANLPQLARPC